MRSFNLLETVILSTILLMIRKKRYGIIPFARNAEGACLADDALIQKREEKSIVNIPSMISHRCPGDTGEAFKGCLW